MNVQQSCWYCLKGLGICQDHLSLIIHPKKYVYIYIVVDCCALISQFYPNIAGLHKLTLMAGDQVYIQQGKSEGFESCDWPIVQKRSIWVKIGDVLYRVTLKFDGWPWKTNGHLSFAVSSFVQYFIAIGEFKPELQSGNTQFGSNSTIFRAVWPWNLTYDLEKQ